MQYFIFDRRSNHSNSIASVSSKEQFLFLGGDDGKKKITKISMSRIRNYSISIEICSCSLSSYCPF